MPNIVVSFYNYLQTARKATPLPPFYEGFVNGLATKGNHVLCYYHDQMTNSFSKVIPEEIFSQLTAFQPDLFIFFNNNFWDVTKYFKDVPVLLYDVDSPALYVNTDNIKKNKGRYFFIVNQVSGKELLQSEYTVSDDRICYIPPFTEVHAKPAETETSILFCGSHWLWSGCDFIFPFMKSQPNREDRIAAQKVLKRFYDAPYSSYDDLYEEICPQSLNKLKFDVRFAAGRLSGIKRARYLTNVCDLGLEIRGNCWNHTSLNYFPEIALCYNSKEVVSLEDTEQAYNSAKIGLNINHLQAQSGFSWRVCDIMASNSCLVTEHTTDIDTLFSGVGLPVYHDAEEERRQCIRILNDDDLRLRIIERSHEKIDNNHRFKHTLDRIETFIGEKLHNESEKGSLELYKLKPEWVNKKMNVPNKMSFSQKVERKIWTIVGNDLKQKGVL